MSKITFKKQKNKYRKLNSAQQIAEYINLHRGNIDKTYFNDKNPKKLNMGKALDIGVFVLRHGMDIEEVAFMVDFIKSHKEYIKNKL